MSSRSNGEQLSDEQISQLLEVFKKSDFYEKDIPRRRRCHQENSKWLQPHVIKDISNQDLKNKFIDYYKGGEGRQTFNQIWRDRIVRNIDRFRDVLLYLLDESLPFDERFKEVTEGSRHIEGMGKGLASAFLMDFNMEKYCLWNNKTEMGFNVLKWEIPEAENMGKKYVKVLELLRRLRDEINPNLKLDYSEVDAFLHWVSAEKEGIESVEKVAGKRPDVSALVSPREKFVQELLKKNFNKILGEKLGLKIYDQDPDNYGVEFYTGVGRIDFLTIDQNGNFVVIEVKAGKAGDSALGQIQRYMGWIKNELAKGREVRGIILTEDVHENLKYALEFAKNISIYKYELNINIEQFS